MTDIRPHYIWRRPTKDEYALMNTGMKEHIDMGGLEMYPNPPIVRTKPVTLA